VEHRHSHQQKKTITLQYFSTMADPNGWVQNPPSTFVKINGTSRETLNGQLGLVLQYLEDRGRYMVVLSENQQSQVALKPENLTVCAGMLDKAKAYYQMLKNNPQVRQQFQQVQTQIQSRTGLKAEYILAIILVSFTVCWYFIGFSKVMMLLTSAIIILTVMGPDLAAGKDLKTCLRNAPTRWRSVVQEQVPVVGPKIAANPWYLRAFTVLLTVFVLYSLLVTPNHRPRGSVAKAPPAASASLAATTVELQQKYYKLGFDDASAGQEFGTSLPNEPVVLTVEDTAAVDGISSAASSDSGYSSWRRAVGLENDFDTYAPVAAKKKSPFNLSTAFAAFTIYRILSPIAMNAEGRFDLPLLRANLSNLEVYKLGILAFSVYRLVSAFL